MSEIEKAIQVLTARSHFVADINLDAQMAYRLAVKALQEKLERENPQPLGLEEIKAIKRPIPLYKILISDDTGEYIGTDNQWWDVCCGTTEATGIVYWRSGHTNRIEDYGKTWLAYRYEPKHIGEAANMVEGE